MAKILIAEDERDIRDLITFTLSFGGYEVVAAGNGEEAVTLAKQELPDLILLDVRMPRMTGYEACAAIKADERLRDIPVIFLSAKGQESEIQAGLQAGASEYLLKPFAPDQLTARIKTVLARAVKAPSVKPVEAPREPAKPAPPVEAPRESAKPAPPMENVKPVPPAPPPAKVETEKPAAAEQPWRPAWPLADSLRGMGEFFREEEGEDKDQNPSEETERPLIDDTSLPDWIRAGEEEASRKSTEKDIQGRTDEGQSSGSASKPPGSSTQGQSSDKSTEDAG